MTTVDGASPPLQSSQHPLIILLKTKSTPHDPYETLLLQRGFQTHFLPVLTHVLLEPALHRLRSLLISTTPLEEYSGLILTSQRAVEAFEGVVRELETLKDSELVLRWRESVQTVYVVGPATGDAVTKVLANRFPLWDVQGQDSGNGDALAQYILQQHAGHARHTGDAGHTGYAEHAGHANQDERLADEFRTQATPSRPRLLFIAGEQRRDTLPRTLMSADLPPERRIPVDELLCYQTQPREGVRQDLEALLRTTEAMRPSANHASPDLSSDTNAFHSAADVARPGGEAADEDRVRVWIVIFSPAGCEAVLQALGWDRQGAASQAARRRQGVRLASIGPTTRDHLRSLGVQVDVCAARPSPAGIADGITKWAKID